MYIVTSGAQAVTKSTELVAGATHLETTVAAKALEPHTAKAATAISLSFISHPRKKLKLTWGP
jgi:hypothetical protein